MLNGTGERKDTGRELDRRRDRGKERVCGVSEKSEGDSQIGGKEKLICGKRRKGKEG